jgi:2-polyprenyl-6-hydroxyphenyl methylase / 3-demethylubiquinone-9 3-methyltransferase
VEWFVKNTPPRLHELSHFIKPTELRAMCEESGLRVIELHGFVPRFNRPFWRLLVTGVVADDFTFQFARNTLTGYIGIAVKSEESGALRPVRQA